MITVISGTNRPNSFTAKFAGLYYKELLNRTANVNILSLEHLPVEVLSSDVYEKGAKPNSILQIQESYFSPAEKFIFIIPEYNGSFPGILKLLIDVMDPKIAFSGKKAALVGVSTGRAGNLRGMDHLASVLQNMNVTVMPYMLPVSKVQFEFDEQHQLKESTWSPVFIHLDKMLQF